MRVTEELEILKTVCQRLDEAAIPYMVTGSLAANFYAVPRMTRDIDIVIEIQKKDAHRLLEVFQKDFYIDRDSITEAIETQGMFNIIHSQSVLKVDFIVRKDSLYRKTEFERRRRIQIDEVSVRVVTPEDLILSKLFWAKDSSSELQLGDVRNLLRTLKDMDWDYLEKWVGSLGLEAVYAKVKNE